MPRTKPRTGEAGTLVWGGARTQGRGPVGSWPRSGSSGSAEPLSQPRVPEGSQPSSSWPTLPSFGFGA